MSPGEWFYIEYLGYQSTSEHRERPTSGDLLQLYVLVLQLYFEVYSCTGYGPCYGPARSWFCITAVYVATTLLRRSSLDRRRPWADRAPRTTPVRGAAVRRGGTNSTNY